MGVVSVLLLFVSVLLHELSHSLVAKVRKIKVDSITLFFFGGVASIDDEDMKASSEFLMSLAGPLFSLLLFVIFYLIYALNGNSFWTAITYYLYQINLILALFNLVPGYPLDGGRAFRAILYNYYKDIKKATKVAVLGGRFFAIFLIVIGMINLFSGSGFGGGLWFVFLGGFLYFIAGVSYEQVVMKDALSQITVKDLLQKEYIMINPSLRFSEFLQKYQDSDEEVFLVKGTSFRGVLDLKNSAPVPAKMHKMLAVKQLATPLSEIGSLQRTDSAYAAFRKFSEHNIDLLPVMEKSKLLGFVTRKKVMHRLIWSLKYGQGGKKK